MRRNLQRLVRIFILAARLFHSQLQIAFSSAESGRISGQADLHIFYPNVSVQVRRLVRRNLQRLVRNFILAVRLFNFPFIPESVLPLHLCVDLSSSVHFLFERHGSPSRRLRRVRWNRLLCPYFSLGFIENAY